MQSFLNFSFCIIMESAPDSCVFMRMHLASMCLYMGTKKEIRISWYILNIVLDCK